MQSANNKVNLVLSGGGIKGISFVGALEEAEKKGYEWLNIAGVSAGALVGAYLSAGYETSSLKNIIYQFDFKNIEMNDLKKKIPAIARFIEYKNHNIYRKNIDHSIEMFLSKYALNNQYSLKNDNNEFLGYRGNILKNIIKLSKDGYLLDGDYLEEWVYSTLLKKGVRTFADLRNGMIDKLNPNGYKVRMTAVDANRGKIIVLPDDIAFYGIEPDKLEVAKAVRMSTCVPLAFKPVELSKIDNGIVKTYHILDGGVFDSFPVWLIEKSKKTPIFGFKFDDGSKKKIISVDTPLNILKGILSKVHDIGIPKYTYDVDYLIKINSSNVSFLDLNLNNDEKNYLFEEGKKCMSVVLNTIV